MSKLTLLDTIKISISNTHKHAKVTFYCTIVNSIISAGKVYIFAYINQLLLNELSNALLNSQDLAFFAPVAKLVLYNWMLVLLFSLIAKIINYCSMKSLLKYDLIMNKSFSTKLSSVNISCFDDPKQYDFINQAYKDMSSLLGMFETLIGFVTTFISFVSAFIIILNFNPIISLVILLSSLPSLFIKKKIKNDSYEIEQQSARIRRRSNYFFNVFKDKNASLDIRMHCSLKDLMLKKYDLYTTEKNQLKQKQYKRNTKLEFAFAFFQGLVDVILNLNILYTIIKNKLSIGEFSFYSTITQNFKKSLENCFTSISDILIFSRRIYNYTQFIEQKNEDIAYGKEDVNINTVHKITFKNVSFKYPNSNVYVLKDLNFDFSTNEKVAFAGINGAGKTTIIKLLLGFYEPTSGEIQLDGINIKNFSITSYRQLFSVMFQNYVNYNIKVYENILLNETLNDPEGVISALEIAELPQFKSDPKSIESEYSKYFNADGLVLSLGQAQKLNMARAIYKNSQVYIFDEPSASLDAKSEQSIFDKVFEITHNKGLILISHKLNNLKKMDKIIFLSNCTVEDVGDHRTLIENDGTYNKLYSIQLNNFVDQQERTQ